MKGSYEMTLKRNYLTSEEIAFVTGSMINATDEYQRQIMRYGLVAQFTVDGLDVTDDIINDDIYDMLIENSIDLDKSITNIDIIDKIVGRELSLANVIDKGIDKLIARVDESTDKFANLDFKSLLVELNKLKDSDAVKMLANA